MKHEKYSIGAQLLLVSFVKLNGTNCKNKVWFIDPYFWHILKDNNEAKF